MSNDTVQLEGDGPSISIAEPEARQMAQALQAVLADTAAVAQSGAPLPLQQSLVRDYAPEPFSMGGQIRAGEWLLVSSANGPRWDLRMVAPEAPRKGLIFQVPLIKADQQWRAASVVFVRAW